MDVVLLPLQSLQNTVQSRPADVMHFGKPPVSRVRAVCYVSSEGDVGGEELTPHQLCLTQENDPASFSPHIHGDSERVMRPRSSGKNHCFANLVEGVLMLYSRDISWFLFSVCFTMPAQAICDSVTQQEKTGHENNDKGSSY